jgi:putative ABC transport system ATP-binding protein
MKLPFSWPIEHTPAPSSPASPALVEAERVSRAYDGGRIEALSEVTLAITKGESVAVMGASGSGKSTLLNILCGLDSPTAGRVLVDGRDPASSRAWAAVRARRIGIVFQSFNLLPALSACENVEVPMFGVVRGAVARRRRALDLLDEVGLAARARHRPFELSGGERQRVAIARSLANDPALLLADEPTGSLDSKNAAAIVDLLLDLQWTRGMGLMIVTHDPDIARAAARQITMRDGRIAA